ncbi:prephenate dehydrogenase/arogenate dehydrogenase family protein [Candidatus Woesearchaeota archaeon]|nr:prephenate dehydrogenase/arogenate dehydrogenase family protein [Candidatus Woesearchaeota archaeon]
MGNQNHSLRHQNPNSAHQNATHENQSSNSAAAPKVIGIIGGMGQMGQWFKRFFEKEGYEVLAASRTTALSCEDCAKKSDVVIITIPIDQTVAMIKRIGPLIKEEGLLMDLTSIKQAPVQAMLESSRCAVIGTHPMFGPKIRSFKNQTIVLCPARPGNFLPWLSGILGKHKALIKIATPEQHDKAMTIVQGITHFSSIAMCHSLRELGVPINETEDYSSPMYRVFMDMVGRIMSHDSNLYADIEMLNPLNPEALRKFISNAQQLLHIIESKDKGAFNNYFREASDYLGDFKFEAEYYSTMLIHYLVDRGKRRGEKP